MRKLIFVLLAFLAVCTFIRALDAGQDAENLHKKTVEITQ